MQHPSWLLLLLCSFLPADSFRKCSLGESCLEVKSCRPSPAPQPPFLRCAFHPTRVCCKQKKMEQLQQKPLDPGKCGLAFGKPSLEGLIVGGEEAEKGKWPWMVSILSQEKKKKARPGPICTGFLIDQRHVLTAAHCFRTTNPGLYSVRLGDRGKEVRVSRVLLHPSYRPKWFHDDVALLTLALDLPRAHPVCLPSNPLDARSATVLGWGATRTSGPMSERLRELGGLPVVEAAECERSLREHLHHHFEAILPRSLDASLLCAGAAHKDTCNGDSGGPLMVQEGGRWFAVGVVAFGTSKCAVGVPGVYTSVAHYVPWIQQNKEK